MSGAEWKKVVSRLGAEFAIVVLGVTIALWADGWVADRGNRSKADAMLEALLVNIDGTLEDLNRSIDNASGAVDALRNLATPAGQDVSQAEHYGHMFYGLLYGPDFEAELNVYDDLKSSGELALLTTPGVRQSLARMDAQLRRVKQMERDVIAVMTSNIDLYLVDNLDMRTIYQDELGVTFDMANVSGNRDYLDDPGFRNRILLKLDVVLYLIKEYEDMQGRLQEARNTIVTQLGARN